MSVPVRSALRRVLSSVVVVATAVSTLGLTAAPAHASGVVSSCDETSFLAAVSGGGAVTFSLGGTPCTITLTAPVTIASDTTIDGTSEQVTISGNDLVQLFVVQTGTTLNLNDLTLAHANNNPGGFTYGGAIDNSGTLTIKNSTLRNNTSGCGVGGAVYNRPGGILTVNRSTISANHAPCGGVGGGGIFNDGTLTVTRSTISGNDSAFGNGGGVDNNTGATATITNSTVSGNSANGNNVLAHGDGGGIYNAGTLTLSASTVADNTSVTGVGGGIFASGGGATVKATIVANNTGGGNCAGTIVDSGYNISSDGTCGFSGTSLASTNPQLSALADHGGPTQTYDLQAASPAIDAIPAGNAACTASDQRSVGRPVGAGCDVGAVERITGTVFSVDSTGDQADATPGDGHCLTNGNTCTLRAAIQESNASAGSDVIEFWIPGSGPQTIQPGSSLPALTDSVTIDGSTQNGYTAAGGPVVAISGSSIPNSNGLEDRATTGSTTINALQVTGFSGSGAAGIVGAGSNQMAVTGNVVFGNDTGIWATQPSMLIGGTDAATRNVIFGNGSASNGVGIKVQAANVTIWGNYIGTDASGTADGGTQAYGIDVQSAGSGTVIGGSTSGRGNVISGNDRSGIQVSATNVTVQGNDIGTDVTGSTLIPNTSSGIIFNGFGAGSLVGGPNPGEGNVMATAGNGAVYVLAVSNVTIQGNSIGVNAAGTALLGAPSGFGVRIQGAGNTSSTPADTNTVKDNVIGGAGSSQAGIEISSSSGGLSASSNVIKGNFVGTDPTETLNLGNAGAAIRISGPLSASNTIGTSAAPNVVANSGGGGNGGAIVVNSNPGNGNTIAYDRIDGNATNGILVVGGSATTVGPGNTIWSNTSSGVKLVGTTNASVIGNTVGLRPNGAAAGNGAFGIMVVAHGPTLTANNTGTVVGGTGASDGNVVVNNGFGGIFLGNPGSGTTYVTSNATVQGNLVGVTAANVAGPNGGASGAGIAVGGDGGNHDITIGGTATGAANTVANNAKGVIVQSATPPNVRVMIAGNSIKNDTGLGIDLGDDGVTPNDSGDGDSGANHLQNFPVLSNATTDGTNTSVDISLGTTASTDVRIDVYSSPSCDTSGNGEGATYLGSVTGTTPASGPLTTSFTGAGVVTGSVLTATATVTTAGPSQGDTSEFSACATVASGTLVPDLAVAITPPASPFTVQPISYTVTVTNSGAADATGVSLDDTLPAGLTDVQATPSQGDPCTVTSTDVTCALGTIAAGADATVTIDATAPTSAGTITNAATATENETDANTADNTDSVDADVQQSTTDLGIAVAAEGGQVYAGQPTTYVYTVTNSDPGTATAPVFTDTIPAQLSNARVCVSPDDCSLNSNFNAFSGTRTLPSLAPGDTVTVTLKATTDTAFGPITNVASVAPGAGVADTASGNDSASQDRTTLNPAPGFAAPTSYAAAVGGKSWIAVGNFDGANGPDLAVSSGDNSGQVAIFLNDGHGAYTAGTTVGVGGTPTFLDAADLNGDGKADLVVSTQDCAGGGAGCGQYTVALGDGAGGFTVQTPVNVIDAPRGIVLADVNGDGKVDLLTADQNGADLSVFLGAGDGTFGAAQATGSTGGKYGIAVGKFDADAKLDVALTSSTGTVTALLGKGDGTFQAGVDYALTSTSSSPWPVNTDVQGDGFPDVLVGGNAQLLLGNGDGTFQDAAEQLNAPAADAAVAGDFNGDGQIDIEAAEHTATQTAPFEDLTQLDGAGDGTFVQGDVAHLPSRVIGQPVAPDVNGDGVQDLVLPTANGVMVLRSAPTPPVSNLNLTVPSTAPAGFTDISANALDFADTGLLNGTLEGAAGPLDQGFSASALNKGMLSGTGNKGFLAGTGNKGMLAGTSSKGMLSAPLGKGMLSAPLGKGMLAGTGSKGMLGGTGNRPVGAPGPMSQVRLDTVISPCYANSADCNDLVPPLLTQVGLDLGWNNVLQGTVFADVPLQRITLNDIRGNQGAWDKVGPITLDHFDFSGTQLGDLPLAALMYGTTPVSAIGLPDGWSWNDSATNPDQRILSGLLPSCVDPIQTGAAGTSQTLVQLGFARCDLTALPWDQMTVTSGNVSTLATAPIGRFQLDALTLEATRFTHDGVPTTVGALPVSDLPSGAVLCGKQLADGTTVNCSGGTTLTDVQSLEGACVSARLPNDQSADQAACGVFDPVKGTFGSLLTASGDPLGGMRLVDFLLGGLQIKDFPFQYVIPPKLVASADVTPTDGQSERVAFDALCPLPNNASVTVTLPSDLFRYNPAATPGFAVGTGPTTVAAGQPTITDGGQTLRWSLAPACAGQPDGQTHVELGFRVLSAPDAGAFTTKVKVFAGTTTQRDAGVTTLTEAQGTENDQVTGLPTGPNDTGKTPVLQPGQLSMGTFSSATDVNYYNIPVTQADLGLLVTGNLMSIASDTDLVVYGASQPSLTAQGFSAGPLNKGVGDQEGCLPQGYSLEQETLDGVPVLSDPNLAVRGYSTGRENPYSIVCTTIQQEDVNRGYITLQVSHYDGPTTGDPYTVWYTVQQTDTGGSCQSPDTSTTSGTGTTYTASTYSRTLSAGSNVSSISATNPPTTLFLIDEDRFGDIYGAQAEQDVLAKLNQLASDPRVNGAIVPVESDPTVQAAYHVLDANPCSPTLHNTVVADINQLVKQVTTVGSSQVVPDNVVIVGSDDIVPFARIRDLTTLGNQVAYATSVQSRTQANDQIDNPLSKSFAGGYYLSDDPYGTFGAPTNWLNNYIYVPTAGIGRVVETPAEIIGQFDRFLNQGPTLDPTTALVTSTDGSETAAAQQAKALQNRADGLNSEIQQVTESGQPTGGTFTLTFQGQTTGPLGPNATAGQVESALVALSNVGTGNVNVTGTAGGPWTVFFQGSFTNVNVGQMTAASSFSGGANPSVVVATTQQGGSSRYSSGTLFSQAAGGFSSDGGWTREQFLCRLNGGTWTSGACSGQSATRSPALIGINGHFNHYATLNGDANKQALTNTTDVVGTLNDTLQTVTVSNATGGTFTLSLGGSGASAPIPFDATTSQLESAVGALGTVGIANVSVDGVQVNGSSRIWTVRFAGSLSNTAVAQMGGVFSGLTGSGATGSVAVTHTGAAVPLTNAATGTSIPDGSVLFTIGCNSGVNVPDSYVANQNPNLGLDWAQALSERKGALVANEGFGYGAGTRVAYSEALMKNFAQNLNGAYEIGAALSQAKSQLLADTGDLTPYDVKSMQESVLYGLPFWGITGNGRQQRQKSPSVVSEGNLAVASLSIGDAGGNGPNYFVNPTSDLKSDGANNWGNFYVAGGAGNGVLQTPGFPIEPASKPIYMSVDNERLKGVLITGLTVKTPSTTFDPVISQVVLNGGTQGLVEPSFSTGTFPTSFTSINQVAGDDYLTIDGGQFTADPLHPGTGTQRVYPAIAVKAYYSAASDTDVTPPNMTVNALQLDATTASFTATSTSPDAAAAWVLWRPSNSDSFTLSPLTQTSTGVFSSGAIATGAPVAEYVVQMRDASGNFKYVTGTALSQPVAVTAGTASITPNQGTSQVNGFYNGDVTFSLSARTYSTMSVRVGNGPVQTFTGFGASVNVPAVDGLQLISYSFTPLFGATQSSYLAVQFDLSPPQVSVVAATPLYQSGGTDYVSATTPITANVSDAGAGVYQCRIDVSGPNGFDATAACAAGANPVTLGGADGAYTVTVWAIDAADPQRGDMSDALFTQGAQHRTKTVYLVTKDSSSPDITSTVTGAQYPAPASGDTTDGGSSPYVRSDTTIGMAVADPTSNGTKSGTRSCATTIQGPVPTSGTAPTLPNTSCAPGQNPYTLPNNGASSEGIYTVTTVANDNVDNGLTPVASKTVTVKLDNTGPNVTTSVPGSPTYQPSGANGPTYVTSNTQLQQSLADPALAGSQIPGSGLGSCVTNRTYVSGSQPPVSVSCSGATNTYTIASAQPDGVYRFDTTGTDNVGNVGPTGSQTVRLDNTGPTATGTVTGNPRSPVTNTTFVTSSTDLTENVTDPALGPNGNQVPGSGVQTCASLSVAATGSTQGPDNASPAPGPKLVTPGCTVASNAASATTKLTGQDGPYRLQVPSTSDHLGNTTTNTGALNVTLDNSAPTFGFCPIPDPGISATIGASITASATSFVATETASPPHTNFAIRVTGKSSASGNPTVTETMMVTKRVATSTAGQFTYTVVRNADALGASGFLAGAKISWIPVARYDLIGRPSTAIGAGDTTISVAGERFGIPNTPFLMMIGNEQMLVTASSIAGSSVANQTVTYTFTVVRGYNGTTATSHATTERFLWSGPAVGTPITNATSVGGNANLVTFQVREGRFGPTSVPFDISLGTGGQDSSNHPYPFERLTVIKRVAVPNTPRTYTYTAVRSVEGSNKVASSPWPASSTFWMSAAQTVYLNSPAQTNLSIPVTDDVYQQVSGTTVTTVPGSGVQTAGFTPAGPFKNPTYANGALTFTLDPSVGVGTYGVRVGATDILGNTSGSLASVTSPNGRPAQAQCFYDVIYKTSGFVGQNVDAVGTTNAGSAVALVWKVTDYDGVPVTSSSSFVEAASSPNKAVCDVSPEYSVVEEQFAGGSGLQNMGNGSYQFNWKTVKGYAGQCRTLVVRLAQPGLVGPLGKPDGSQPLPSRRYLWFNVKFK